MKSHSIRFNRVVTSESSTKIVLFVVYGCVKMNMDKRTNVGKREKKKDGSMNRDEEIESEQKNGRKKEREKENH